MNEQLVQTIRYVIIAGGSYLAGRKGISPEQIVPAVDQVISAAGAIAAAVAALHGLYVKWNTKSVPAATAARADVPTVSPVTGAVDH